jgi:integrase
MTAKQIEKELNRQAVLFDEKCSAQGIGGGNIKFQALAEEWFQKYAGPNLRPRTVARLHELEARTYKALGHIRVDKLTARNIQSFIDNLGEDGISDRASMATAKSTLTETMTDNGITQKALAEGCGLSCSTVSSMCRGQSVKLSTAEKVAQFFETDIKTLFTVQKGNGRLAPKTIKHYLSFVSDVLDYAFRFGMIQENPCRRVTVPTAAKAERDCYSLEEAQRFLESLEGAPSKYRAFFVLAIYGGLRRGELLGLEWQDVDYENHVISIRRTSQYLKGRGVYTDETKTAKSRRTLKLPVSVFEVLRQHQIEQIQDRLKLGDRWHDTGRLFTMWDGRAMHPNSCYHWLSTFCEKTGQRFLGVHAFRHLNASLLINSGADVKTVSASLGHSNTTTTLDIYSHTFQAAQARAAEAVADVLETRIKKMG